jgi:hypothetical protein
MAVGITQILLLIALLACVAWLVIRARQRSDEKYEEHAPEPPSVDVDPPKGEAPKGNGSVSQDSLAKKREQRRARREARLAGVNGSAAAVEPMDDEPEADEPESAPTLEPVPDPEPLPELAPVPDPDEPKPEESEPEVVELPEPDDPAPVVAEWDTSEQEAELESIYERIGKPEAVSEAKDKVRDLAQQRTADGSWSDDEALHKAYQVSLAEHREYLAAQASPSRGEI